MHTAHKKPYLVSYLTIYYQYINKSGVVLHKKHLTEELRKGKQK